MSIKENEDNMIRESMQELKIRYSFDFSPEISRIIEERLQQQPEMNQDNIQTFIEDSIRFYHNVLSQGLSSLSHVRKKEDLEQMVNQISQIVRKQDDTELKDHENDHDFVDYIFQSWNLQGVRLSERTAIYLRLGRIAQHLSHLENVIRAEPNGLTQNELLILLAIRRNGPDSHLSPSFLKETLLVSPSAISKQIERLRKKGYVERITDEEDRRSVWVKLTPAGLDLINSIASNDSFDHTLILEKMTKDEQQVLNLLLNKLLLLLEKEL